MPPKKEKKRAAEDDDEVEVLEGKGDKGDKKPAAKKVKKTEEEKLAELKKLKKIGKVISDEDEGFAAGESGSLSLRSWFPLSCPPPHLFSRRAALDRSCPHRSGQHGAQRRHRPVPQGGRGRVPECVFIACADGRRRSFSEP
jgi:hypothetical protein